MKQDDVPAALQHLPFVKGYPVPYFVAWFHQDDLTRAAPPKIDPQIHAPNFNLSDERKWYVCAKYGKCWVCGKTLGKSSPFMITGPLGLETCTQSDLLMHEDCAKASLQVCPYMFYQKVDRDEHDHELAMKLSDSSHIDRKKPASLVLIKVGQYRYITIPSGAKMINFQPLSVRWYDYQSNRLISREPHHLETFNNPNWKCPGRVFDPKKLTI